MIAAAVGRAGHGRRLISVHRGAGPPRRHAMAARVRLSPEMPELSRLLQTACYVVIGYLSGMRDSEKRAELRLMQHSAAATTG